MAGTLIRTGSLGCACAISKVRFRRDFKICSRHASWRACLRSAGPETTRARRLPTRGPDRPGTLHERPERVGRRPKGVCAGAKSSFTIENVAGATANLAFPWRRSVPLSAMSSRFVAMHPHTDFLGDVDGHCCCCQFPSSPGRIDAMCSGVRLCKPARYTSNNQHAKVAAAIRNTGGYGRNTITICRILLPLVPISRYFSVPLRT
jgi:hypothetical protein